MRKRKPHGGKRQNSGWKRPAKRTKRIVVYVEPETEQHIKERAIQDGKSVSAFLNHRFLTTN